MTITDHTPDHRETTDDQLEPDQAGNNTEEHCVEQDHLDVATVVAAGADQPELLRVDPGDLIIGANVRLDVGLDKAFVRSIADRGVREPIITRRRPEDGALVVRKGKRRTLAAIDVGRASVPVLVEPGAPPEESDRAGLIDQIIDQVEENLHRAGNTELEEVRAHQQLLDLGLTAGQIARRTHSSTKRVKTTTTVARSVLASEVMARFDLTLDQVAVIAEFDDGTPAGVEAVQVLTVTVQTEPGQFEHVAQRLRDDREDARAVAARTTELAAAGIIVLDPDAADGAAQITGLRPTAGEPSGTELTADAHAACPGHAAQVEVRRGWDRQPQVRTTYWCTDPTAHGHAARWDAHAARGSTGGAGGPGARAPGPLSDAEKAERRRVIANNREWDSATTVRRDWLRALLARRTPPRNAAQFIATTLARGGHDLRRAMESGHPTACELLGMTAPGSVYTGRPSPIADAAITAGAPRATMLALAVLLGAAEDATSRDTWRNPTTADRIYLTALTEWGYGLSDVEQQVVRTEEVPTPARTAETTADPAEGDADATSTEAFHTAGDDVGDDVQCADTTGNSTADHAEPDGGAGEAGSVDVAAA